MSTIAQDADSEWDDFEGVEQVEYVPYVNGTDSMNEAAKVIGVDALTEEVTKEETDAAGNLIFRATRNFALRVSTMNGVKATKRGLIRQADGTEWVVERCVLRTFNTRWRCSPCHRKEENP